MNKELQRRLYLLRHDLVGYEEIILRILTPAYPGAAKVLNALLGELADMPHPEAEEKKDEGILSPIQYKHLEGL